jgi:hypothetical protein
MSKYCFIANYYLTPLQIQVAKGLKKRGVDSCWIVVNEHLYQSILEAGWSIQDILYLCLPSGPIAAPFCLSVPLKLNDLLTADRALREAPERGMAYLHQAASQIIAFLDTQQPEFVFGENTWAHERIAAAVCRFRGNMTFLSPHTVRFPAGRWGFFLGEDQADLFLSLRPPEDVTESPQCIAADQPTYVKRNDELLAGAMTVRARLKRIKRFLTRENISKSDPTHIQSRYATLKIAGGEELNRILYRFVKRVPPDPELLSQPFVLYALHKQPESSIDVIGRYYEDQLKLIHSIWRTLPTGWYLYVKEHSNAIGDRTPDFYRQIAALPNTKLVHEKASAGKLIRASQAVFTVSGTIAYEAALLGKKSFTFVPMFFNKFECCKAITIDTLRNVKDLREVIEARNPAAISDAESYILSRSFRGMFTDVHSCPEVLHPDNVTQLVSAFYSVCRK